MSRPIAYIGLGANQGDRASNLLEALELLESRGALEVVALSGLYETVPMYVTDQPPFLNAVAKARSRDADPERLLADLLNVEYELGRRRLGAKRFGPRPIDLDLLLFGALEHTSPTLEVPHPRMHERAFVLVPLCELAPRLQHPVTGANFSDLLDNLPERDTVILDTSFADWPSATSEVA